MTLEKELSFIDQKIIESEQNGGEGVKELNKIRCVIEEMQQLNTERKDGVVIMEMSMRRFKLLQDIYPNRKNSMASITSIQTTQIKQYIAEEIYLISIHELETGRKWYPHVEARKVCMYILAKHVYNNLDPVGKQRIIGHLVGNKDRTTVLHAITSIHEAITPISSNSKIPDMRIKKVIDRVETYVLQKIIKNETINV